MSRYSKKLEILVNRDQRLEDGSYYHDSDGHWASTEVSHYSIDDGALATVHAGSVQDFLEIVRKEIVSVPHESYLELN